MLVPERYEPRHERCFETKQQEYDSLAASFFTGRDAHHLAAD